MQKEGGMKHRAAKIILGGAVGVLAVGYTVFAAVEIMMPVITKNAAAQFQRFLRPEIPVVTQRIPKMNIPAPVDIPTIPAKINTLPVEIQSALSSVRAARNVILPLEGARLAREKAQGSR